MERSYRRREIITFSLFFFAIYWNLLCFSSYKRYKPIKMIIMKIELKNIKFSEALSEETNAFTADLHINSKKVGYCKNTGQGGCTDYNGYNPEDRKTIAEAEAYCKTLPDIDYGTFKIKSNLESVIDQLFEDWLKAEEEKKMEKHMQTCILFGVPNSNEGYGYLDFKQPLTEVPAMKLKIYISKIINEKCKNNIQILNTNFKVENGEVVFN